MLSFGRKVVGWFTPAWMKSPNYINDECESEVSISSTETSHDQSNVNSESAISSPAVSSINAPENMLYFTPGTTQYAGHIYQNNMQINDHERGFGKPNYGFTAPEYLPRGNQFDSPHLRGQNDVTGMQMPHGQAGMQPVHDWPVFTHHDGRSTSWPIREQCSNYARPAQTMNGASYQQKINTGSYIQNYATQNDQSYGENPTDFKSVNANQISSPTNNYVMYPEPYSNPRDMNYRQGYGRYNYPNTNGMVPDSCHATVPPKYGRPEVLESCKREGLYNQYKQANELLDHRSPNQTYNNQNCNNFGISNGYGLQQENPTKTYTPSKIYRKHKEPMKFNGKTDWKDYHSHFLAVAEWNGWNLEESGLQLAISLVDEAREILSSLPHFERNNYHSIINALKQRYDPDGHENSYSMELMNRARKSGEDTTAYGYALLRLAHKAYPNMPLPEQILINLYINGLGDKDLKRHVYLSKPTTLEMAIKTASIFEGFDEKPPKKKIGFESILKKPQNSEINAVTNTQSATQIVPDMLKNIEKTMTEMSSRLNKLENGAQSSYKKSSNKSHIQCYRCQNFGHYSKFCPQNTDRRPRPELPRQDPPRLDTGSSPTKNDQDDKTHLNK